MNRLRLTALPVLLLAGGIAAAQQPIDASSIEQSSGAGDESLGGLVVNQTFTRYGDEFFRLFAMAMQERPDGQSVVLSVVERPLRRQGSRISIMLGQQSLYEVQMPFRRDRLPALSEAAVEKTVAGLALLQSDARAGSDIDLAATEI